MLSAGLETHKVLDVQVSNLVSAGCPSLPNTLVSWQDAASQALQHVDAYPRRSVVPDMMHEGAFVAVEKQCPASVYKVESVEHSLETITLAGRSFTRLRCYRL